MRAVRHLAAGHWGAAEHLLLSLARQHHEQATQELIGGRFSPFNELSNPKRGLVVYRRRHGSGIVGDDYYVAQPTYISVEGKRRDVRRIGQHIGRAIPAGSDAARAWHGPTDASGKRGAAWIFGN